jgi:hypothetical protein
VADVTIGDELKGRRLRDWDAESVRVTLIGPAITGTQQRFAVVFGIEPEELVSRPAQKLVLEKGIVQGYRVNLNQQVGRLDLFLSDDPAVNTFDPSQASYKPFFSIGPFRAAFEVAGQLGSKLAEQFVGGEHGIIRVGYAPVLFARAESRIEANRFLADLLPSVNFNPEVDSDILWQINRPRQSQRLDCRLNRLVKWQTLASMLTTAQLVEGGVMLGAGLPSPGLEKFTVRVEMDLNAFVPRTEEDLAVVIRKLLAEFQTLASEIAEKGDVP